MAKKIENEIKILDLVDEIKKNKNVTKKNLIRVIKALPIVIKKILLNKQEIIFENFFKLGFRTAKDRITKTRACKKRNIKSETLHMPAHLRFKSSFFTQLKKELNESKEK